MSYLNVEQKIASSIAEVDTKIKELISESGVDSDEIKFLKIIHYGASRFLCLIVYAMLREVRLLSSKIGLKASPPIKRLSFNRTFSVAVGLISSIKEVTNDIDQLFSSKFGLVPFVLFKLATKLNTSFGLIAATPLYIVAFNKDLIASTGLKVTWEAALNGVTIELG
jgi:purine-cytosine permease-like protein